MRLPILATAMLVASAPTAAEVLPIRWGEPAPAAEVAAHRGIALDRFRGTDGPALAIELEQRLSDSRDSEGRAHYALYSLASPGAQGSVEVVIEGNAAASIDERRSQQKRKYCKDADRPRTDCDDKDKEEREVTCRTRVIALATDVRAAREADGRVIYRRAVPLRDEATWCPAQNPPGDADDVVARLVASAAGTYAADLSPKWQAGGIRVLESRSGLSREQGERFKQALQATKTSADRACEIFAGLAAEVPQQRSLAFNMALCSEMRGELEEARAGFAALGDSAGRSAAARVDATIAALAAEQDQVREEPL